SLGGNIALKLAGEAAAEPVPGLERVAALAPPIDLEGSAAIIAKPRNRLYEQYYVRNLLGQAHQVQRNFPDLPRLRFPRHTTLRLFDDLYTAPRGGYRDALDYYRRASAFALVPRIVVPTFILTARDDPFIPAAPFEALAARPNLTLQIVPRGG